MGGYIDRDLKKVEHAPVFHSSNDQYCNGDWESHIETFSVIFL